MTAKPRKTAKSPVLFPPPGGGRKQYNAFPVYPGYTRGQIYLPAKGLRFSRASREIGARSAMRIFAENAVSGKNGFDSIRARGRELCEATGVFFFKMWHVFCAASIVSPPRSFIPSPRRGEGMRFRERASFPLPRTVRAAPYLKYIVTLHHFAIGFIPGFPAPP